MLVSLINISVTVIETTGGKYIENFESKLRRAKENGEYHTFTFDGPLFSKAVEFQTLDPIIVDNFTILPVE